MTTEQRQKLIDSGRKDLVDAFDLLQSGYAGVNSKGTIVDRRIEKDAMKIPENPMFNTPKPKET